MRNKIQLKAAGGIVYRFRNKDVEPQILLIYRNGLWDLPKGKFEYGESGEMCAAREVSEEVGSSIPAIISELGTSYHEYEEEGNIIGKTTFWYAMIFTKNEKLEPQLEEGITNIKWVSLSEAIEEVGFSNLKEILLEFAKQKKV